MNGPRELIPEERKISADKGKGPFYSFRPPDIPTEPSTLSQQRDYVFDDLRINKNLQIGFMTQDESPENPSEPMFTADGMLHGFTDVNTEYMQSEDKDPNATWRVFIFLDLVAMERLLEGDLNSSEREVIQWCLALVVRTPASIFPHLISDSSSFDQISHELIHAVEFCEELIWAAPKTMSHIIWKVLCQNLDGALKRK